MQRRVNGCSKPFDCYQISGAVAFIVASGIFVVCHVPGYNLTGEIVSVALQGGTLVLLGLFWCLATLSDPTDPVMKEYRKSTQENIEHFFHELSKNMQLYVYCTVCQSFVYKGSKHCKRCNRCVAGFDHHCKWFNNCVGRNNYKFFIGTLGSLLLFTGNFIGWGIYSSVLYWQDFDQFVNNFGKFYNGDANSVLKAAQACYYIGLICDAFMLIVFGMTLELSIFHIWLNCKGLTTVEYIESKRVKVTPQIPQRPSQTTKEMNRTYEDTMEVNNNSIVNTTKNENRTPSGLVPIKTRRKCCDCLCCCKKDRRQIFEVKEEI